MNRGQARKKKNKNVPDTNVGVWIWDEDELYYRCSKCGKFAYETLYCMDGTYAYCPFCGKKMKAVIR